MHEITINLDTLLWIAGLIAAVGLAIAYLAKWADPIIRPYKKIRTDLNELKERKASCDLKFENDQRQLAEMKYNDKMIMKSLMLLLKHAETGNCTGEVAAGRKELEEYIIDKD